ncbi:LRR and CARD domains-containing protein 3) (Nucleotide-binding oligomerization domain protein 3) [Durusdinium trenchii]|uniref:LRR and CARD domains-containing protein 3 (Nucleotide-binding oligomerization domain protein 3 n=2 Tax=Durusdinium trenchii TaxID=1381693 RepID=A0ABP0I475_9DINO
MAELAASLPHFENIKVLNIKRFKAGEVEAKAFFEALGSIPLQKLCMSSAVHAEAAGQAMVKALQELDVAAFAALTELDFSYCRMDHGLGEVIAESLKTNRTLTYIDLSWNEVTDVGVQVIAESLKTNRTLTYIDLSWNKVTDVGVQALANALSVNNVLTHLDLNGNECNTVVGKQALHEIEDLLQVNRGAAEAPATTPAKQEQDAGDRADAFCGHPRIQELARQLKKGGAMNEIFFDGSDETLGDDETFGDDEVKVLVETLKVNRSVSSIYLAQAEITDTGVKAIAEMLMHNNRITRINLDYNKIGDSGVEALAEVLKHNRSIIHIYLRWNDIGEVGAKALAEAVQENDVILHIGLDPAESGHQCEDAMRRIDQRCEANQEAKATATVEKLVQELKTDGAKKEIDLRSQYIGDAQVQALSQVLEINESITHIDLSNNPIKDAGAQALAEVLKHNRSITNIDLRYNQIGEVGAEALAEAVQENDAILEIALRGNPLTDGSGPEALERIQERCEANQAAAEARAQSAG